MDHANVAPRPLPFHLLEDITNGFSDDHKLGSGAYGNVYKGDHKDGAKIAVKVLHDILGLDDEQFEKEYINLANLQHKNIVRLVGYCHETRRECLPYNGRMVFADKTKKALCFEYMDNGSLDNFLSDESTGHDWCTRYAIIKGICDGLKYLHEELEPPMYHLDLKPANILLDEKMMPKIADFGLSRLFREEQTQITKSAVGTHGYVPPEYIDAAIISIKFDIFSLGVVIIKIMTGSNGYFRSAEMSSQQFIDLVRANWRHRLHATKGYGLVPYSEQVKRCIEIALSCVEADRFKRPSIGVIVNMLNETEYMIQNALKKDVGSSMHQMCPCISTESELLAILQNKLITYTMRVTTNGGGVHEATVTTICDLAADTTTFELILPRIKILECMDLGPVYTIDVHPTEPWILLGHYSGRVSILNHQTQTVVMAFSLQREGQRALGFMSRIMGAPYTTAVKFIARKQWLVAADFDGYIHVHTYMTKDKLKIFQAHSTWVNSLAVHPSDPFVLSASGDNLIKLWNWETGWECIRTFEAHSDQVEVVKFNPQTASNTFASASRDFTVKIWNMFSPVPVATLDCNDQAVFMDYFLPSSDRQYLVAGSQDGTACIWDLQTNTCIRQIEGLQTRYCNIAVVHCLLGHPILITTSEDNIVSLCDSTTHRYENRVDFKLGWVRCFGYINDIKSLAIACDHGIAIMEVN